LVGLLATLVAVGIAILKYRLYEIDVIINRTLVYGSLTVTLLALYFGGIGVLQRLFIALTGQLVHPRDRGLHPHDSRPILTP